MAAITIPPPGRGEGRTDLEFTREALVCSPSFRLECVFDLRLKAAAGLEEIERQRAR
jgi:hypothetical protein